MKNVMSGLMDLIYLTYHAPFYALGYLVEYKAVVCAFVLGVCVGLLV